MVCGGPSCLSLWWSILNFIQDILMVLWPKSNQLWELSFLVFSKRSRSWLDGTFFLLFALCSMPRKIGDPVCLATEVTLASIPMDSWSSIEVFRSFLAFPLMFHQVCASDLLMTELTLSLLPIRQALFFMDSSHVPSKILRRHLFATLGTLYLVWFTISSSNFTFRMTSFPC